MSEHDIADLIGSDPAAMRILRAADTLGLPETATCVAVTLRAGTVHLVTCHGPDDLTGLLVRPSPAFDTEDGRAAVLRRAGEKGWIERWPGLRLAVGQRHHI